jgi:ketosteroid isomerase-like protein
MTDLPAWGHAAGLLDLTPENTRGSEPAPAHAAMIDRMSRYAWAFDERRVDLLADNFTEDATWIADIRGEQRIGPHLGRDAIVAFMSGFWPVQTDQRRHMILNHLVTEVSDDTGTILSYHLLMAAMADALVPVTTGFYSVQMRREADGCWRISSLLAGYDIPF